MSEFYFLLRSFANDECGATSIEYGLIAAMIGVAMIGAIQKVGSNLSAKYNQVGTALH